MPARHRPPGNVVFHGPPHRWASNIDRVGVPITGYARRAFYLERAPSPVFRDVALVRCVTHRRGPAEARTRVVVPRLRRSSPTDDAHAHEEERDKSSSQLHPQPPETSEAPPTAPS